MRSWHFVSEKGIRKQDSEKARGKGVKKHKEMLPGKKSRKVTTKSKRFTKRFTKRFKDSLKD